MRDWMIQYTIGGIGKNATVRMCNNEQDAESIFRKDRRHKVSHLPQHLISILSIKEIDGSFLDNSFNYYWKDVTLNENLNLLNGHEH